MKQIHMTGDQYFIGLLHDFERELIKNGGLQPGQTMLHRDLRSADYVVTHNLTAAAPESRKTIQTKQGWDFISTGIIADYDGAYTGMIPSISLEQKNVGSGNFSGGTYGGSNFKPEDFDFEEIRNCFGPGANSQFLTESRDYFRFIGDNAPIITSAKLATGDLVSRTVHIILTGWEIRK